MSKGLSPKLPLTKDPVDGYALNKDYIDLVKQNLKMLLLTAPGERILIPEFGVGLRNYLFENITVTTFNTIETRIKEQVKIYMPFIELSEINIREVQSSDGSSGGGIHVNMGFRIIPFDLFTSLEIEIMTN